MLRRNILEIRFKPNPRVVDSKGALIHKYAHILKLNGWSFNDNRFDVFNDDKSTKFFLSYKNMGAVIENNPTNNYFSDLTRKFIKEVFSEEMMSESVIERIGMRTITVISLKQEFLEVLREYNSKLLPVSEKLLKSLNGEINDCTSVITFKTENGKYKIVSGPMRKEQIIKEYFGEHMNSDNAVDISPDVGLFVDVDYWNNPNMCLDWKEIFRLVKLFHAENLSHTDRISSNLLGDG